MAKQLVRMKLTAWRKYYPRNQNNCESVLKRPAMVGASVCVFLFLFLSQVNSQGCPGSLLSVSHSTTSVTACTGYNPASINAIVVGGVKPYTYQWYDNGSPITDSIRPSLDIQQLTTSGNHSYYVVVTDNCGATATSASSPKPINVVTDPLVSITNDASVCQGDIKTLNTLVTGGTGLFNFQWESSPNGVGSWATVLLDDDKPASSYLAPTAAVGTIYYRVVLMPNVGSCNNATSKAVSVTVNSSPAIFNVTGGGEYCDGGTGKAVGLSNSQDGIKYQLQLDGFNAGFPVDGTGSAINFGNQTSAGTYTVIATKVTTSCSVSMNGSVTVTINPLPSATVTGPTEVCKNATSPNITFTGANGTAPYTFTYTINGGTPIKVTTTSGNSITVAVPTGTTGNFTYALVSVIDSKECAQNQSGSATITVNNLPAISVSPVTVCSASPTTLTASGATTYTWSPSTGLSATIGATVTATLSSATTYTVTGTDNNGCSNTTNVTITVNTVSPGSVGSDQTLCFGGDPAAFTGADATGAGTITYQWQSGTNETTWTDVPGATSATYNPPPINQSTFYRRNDFSTLNGVTCSAATNDIEIVISPVTPGTIAADQTICSGGDPAAFTSTADASSTDNKVVITYQWKYSTDGGTTWVDISGATGTTYNVPAGLTVNTLYRRVAAGVRSTGRSTNGFTCVVSSNIISITVNPDITPTFTPVAAICSGAGLSALPTTSNNGIKGTWSPALNNITTTTYTFTPTAGQCATTTTLTIAVNALPAISGTLKVCMRETTQLIGSTTAAAVNAWISSNPGVAPVSNTGLVTGVNAGTTTITYTNSNGCMVSATVIINNGVHADTTVTACNNFTWNRTGASYNATQNVDYIFTNAQGCKDTVTLHLLVTQIAYSTNSVTVCQNQLPYMWNQVSYNTSGTFTFTTKNQAGCDSIATLNLNVVQTIISSVDSTTVCANALPYQWNGITIDSAGTYTATLQSAAGCDSIATLVITTYPLPTATLSGGNPICAGSSATISIALTGIAPWTVVYSDGAITHTITGITSSPYILTVSPAITTTYSMQTVSDAKCINTSLNSSVTVIVMQSVLPGMRYQTITAIANIAKQLSARDMGSGYKYNWSPATGLNYTNIRTPVFKYDKSVEYLISLTPANGCKTVDTLQVQIAFSSSQKSSLYVPTAWTPNNDGRNDKLYPLTVNVKLYYFKVFNRWGQLVFETNKAGEGWDGTFNGKLQSTGLYIWIVKAAGLDGAYYEQSGNSILIR